MRVIPIDKKTADLFVVNKHYSHRASIFWAGFGLEIDGKIEGVVVYGHPSPPVQKHAFALRAFRLYELSRLVVQTTEKNAASFLIGNSLSLLPKPCAVVSYADSEWGHSGIVYQATNWIYTGAPISHDHAYLMDGMRFHPLTIRRWGISNPKEWAKENNIPTAPPMKKHRYFYICAENKKQKKDILATLRYPIVTPYPKSEKTMYDAGERLDVPAT